MKNIFLLLVSIFTFGAYANVNTSYTFNYYTLYESVKKSNVQSKIYYFGNTLNDNYSLYVSTGISGEIYDAELIDKNKKQLIKFKFNKNTLLDINNFNNLIKDFEKLSFDKIFRFKGNTYSKINEVTVGEFSHINYNLYTDKKKKKLHHSILIETKPNSEFKNQFKLRTLFFSLNNYVNLINYNTPNVINKIYRYENDILVFEENLIDIKQTNITLTLN